MALGVTFTGLSSNLVFDYGYVTSLQKDIQRNDDGTPLSEKHTIGVRATIAAGAGAGEARLEDLIDTASSYADLTSTSEGKRHIGTLSIGGSTVYENAMLNSISISEPPEDTAGIHYIEVNMSFEAVANGVLTDYNVRSTSETVEVRREDTLVFDNSDIESDIKYYNYTVVHTISAQGYLTVGKEAYTAAKEWVENRLQDTSIGLVLEDNAYNDILYASIEPESEINLGNISSLSEYNKVRSSTLDTISGSYSVTSTYTRSQNKAIIEIEVSFQKDDNCDVVVTANGSVQGLATESITSQTESTKITNARSVFNNISGGGKFTYACPIFNIVNTAFGRYNTESVSFDTTDLYAAGVTVGENKVSGMITFNASYRAYPNSVISVKDALDPINCISANLVINDENQSGKGFDIEINAIIPIIGRGSNGPIFQDMKTTRERRRTVQLDAVFKAAQRTPNNEAIKSLCINKAKEYAPSGTVFRSNINSSWDFASGRMSVSLEWTYK